MRSSTHGSSGSSNTRSTGPIVGRHPTNITPVCVCMCVCVCVSVCECMFVQALFLCTPFRHSSSGSRGCAVSAHLLMGTLPKLLLCACRCLFLCTLLRHGSSGSSGTRSTGPLVGGHLIRKCRLQWRGWWQRRQTRCACHTRKHTQIHTNTHTCTYTSTYTCVQPLT